MNTRVYYGIDAPEVIKTLLGIGGGLLVLAVAWVCLAPPGDIVFWLALPVSVAALVLLMLGLAMMAYGLRGKFRVRDRLLNAIGWRGNEQVLDVGTGRGLLAIGAAKRLTTGCVTGVDIWNQVDLSGNSQAAAERNAAFEHVADRVRFVRADATALPFADGSFEVVLTLLCIHNIDGREERARALREISRVLKPGGILLLGDYVHTREYVSTLIKAGLRVEGPVNAMATALGLMWILRAEKPSA